MVPRPATNSYSSSNNSTDNIVTYQWWLLFRIDIDVVSVHDEKKYSRRKHSTIFRTFLASFSKLPFQYDIEYLSAFVLFY